MKLIRLALPAAVALAVTVPGAAYAGTLTHADPRGDVVSRTDESGNTVTPAPTRANGDVVGTRITFTDASLKIKVRERDIVRKGYAATLVVIKSGKGRRDLQLIAGPGMYAGKTSMQNGAGKTVKCKGLTHKIDYVGNKELITIPRSCLGNPNWVRVGIGVVTSDDGFNTTYLDDARTTADVSGSDPVLSPRIHR